MEWAGAGLECLEPERHTHCRYEWRRSMLESWHAIPKARWEKKGGEEGRRERRNMSEETMGKRKMDKNRRKDRSGSEDEGERKPEKGFWGLVERDEAGTLDCGPGAADALYSLPQKNQHIPLGLIPSPTHSPLPIQKYCAATWPPNVCASHALKWKLNHSAAALRDNKTAGRPPSASLRACARGSAGAFHPDQWLYNRGIKFMSDPESFCFDSIVRDVPLPPQSSARLFAQKAEPGSAPLPQFIVTATTNQALDQKSKPGAGRGRATRSFHLSFQ